MNLNIYAWGGLVTTLSNLAFASFVYFKNRRGLVNKIYPLFSLSIGTWSLGWFKMISSTNLTEASHWANIASVGSVFIPAFFLHFIFVISDIIEHRRKILIANYILAFIFLFFCYFTNLFIKDIAPIFLFKYYMRPGPIYIFHFLSFAIISIYGVFRLFRVSKIYAGLKRNQIRYLFWAFLIGYTGGITAYFPVYKIPMPFWGVYTIPIAVFMIAYAIVKYRLMDITVTITRTGIFIMVYTLVLGSPFLLGIWSKNWLITFLGTNWWIGPMVLMAAFATAGPFVYISLQRRAEAIFLRQQKEYQKTLKQAAAEMTRIRQLQKLLNLIVDIFSKTVQVSHFGIYLFDTNSKGFLLRAGHNLKKGQTSSISSGSRLISWLQDHREPLVYEEIKRKTQEETSIIYKELEEETRLLNASIIVPSFLENKLSNLLILGDKLSGRIYTSEDLSVFSILASQIALAVENALLYENIEEQVRQRTKELMEVQRQLIQAEKLATVGTLAGGVAHEINNPLTAILTNVQMLLASGGAIDGKFDRESLELIEEATKRCRTIVQKLMTYAKKPLESAEISKVDLTNVLKNVISLLGYQLEQENVKIITDAKEDSYLVMGNQNELEQVVTNIVLNARDAIKQVKKSGDIHISLSKNDDWINIKIKDEGIGIPQEKISKIFDPFFTTKEVGKGTGLGLSICQAIIEKHNGLITVQSEPHKGSVLTIQLPKIEARNKVELKK